MKTRSPYTSFAVISALFVVIFAVAWVFTVRKSGSMKIEIATVSRSIEDASSRNEYLNSLKSVLEESKVDLTVIDARFISKDKIPELIDSIDANAQINHVSVSVGSLNFDETNTAFPRELKVHITGSGFWGDDIRFISFLESIPFASKVDGISLNVQKGLTKDGSNVWNFATDIIVYASN